MATDRIKLVVAKGHTLGYILPELPQFLCVLHTSILKGSSYSYWAGSVMLPKDWRLASPEDFNGFNHSFEGYEDDSVYEFDNSSQLSLLTH